MSLFAFQKIRLLVTLLALATPVFAVEQWGVFELTLQGPSSGNPFTEVELQAHFTQGNKVVKVAGFYDGEGVYKVRFSPDSQGDWSCETFSNRPELQEHRCSFTVTAPTAKNHGPVHVANTFHFAYADGTPFRQIGTTSYSWPHQGEARENQTLRTLAASPFNKIRMCVFPQNQHDLELRFLPFDRTTDGSWDSSRFNPAFFRHLENCVGQLRDLGVEADLIVFHPYGNKWPFNRMDAASDDRYVRYLVARLSAYRNVWWSLCNEWDFLKSKKESDWDRLFQVILAADPYGRLRSIHNGRLRSIHNGFVLYNNSHPWVTHASIQQGAALLDPERAMLYRDVWRKPVVYDEVRYEGNSPRRWGQLTAAELVLRFWNGTIAGCYVGHSEILGLPDPKNPAVRQRPNPRDGYWLGSGGVFRGESVPRLEFLSRILAESPADGINPIDKWQDRRMGGKAGEYYLIYFGAHTPASVPFVLPHARLKDGVRFTAEIIDTWNMTVTPVEGFFETKRKDDYVFADKDGRSIALPDKPYQAIRLRRVGPAPELPPEPEREL